MMEKIFKSLKLRIHIEVQSFLWFKLVILRNNLKHLSKSCKILLVVLYKININNVSSSELLECKLVNCCEVLPPQGKGPSNK